MDDCEIAAKKLDKLILAHNIEPIITLIEPKNPNTMDRSEARYRVDIRGYIIDYPVGHLARTKSVTALELISAILKDTYDCDLPFGSWAQEMGYGEDSREAFKVWEACNATSKWFGDDLHLAINYAIAM